MRILIVEDEEKLATLVSKSLTKIGHTVDIQHDGGKGLSSALGTFYDLVILDVNLPVMDGFAVLKKMREAHNHTRVLILTARGDVNDRVSGLRAGADDYLTKPFSMDELAARIDVLGRRNASPDQGDVLEIADLRMDVRKRKIMRGGKQISLSPREFELLQIFMQEPGRTFTREEICERIWERQHEYDTRTVEIFIMRIRKKVDEGRDTPLIETVRGVGYQLRDGE